MVAPYRRRQGPRRALGRLLLAPAPSSEDLPDALGYGVEFWTRYDAAAAERAETGYVLRIR
ncbi:hypothetical protein ACTI_26390 [Actinoplanes sp. OR16]|uniref:hypothetical protein n=1 Tax=Actinoplanes sp. OR16 TaxID=946334 RepID=UPI000F6F556B|nr:hypothetical protein [Actinoplanes sp. OR16]BBH65954.1 hypothetical protein ACTI_26390 [Actinoplanes sp. OR16]